MANTNQRKQESDLLMTSVYEANSWEALDLAEQASAGGKDLGLAHEGNALRQALLLRLLTPVGSLTALGHPEYGSRMHELIGEPNTPARRRLARSFVLQALKQEQRVAKVLEVDVRDPDQLATDRLYIHVVVEPAVDLDPIALGVEVQL